MLAYIRLYSKLCAELCKALWLGETPLGSVPQWTRVLVSLLALFQLLLPSCWASIWWLSSSPPSPCTKLARPYLSLLYLHLPSSPPQMYCQLQGGHEEGHRAAQPHVYFSRTMLYAPSRSHMYSLTSCARHLGISLLGRDTGMTHLPES